MPSADLIALLRCPETLQALRMATAEESARANVSEGLIRADRQVVYPIHEGIPMLMVEHAVRIAPPQAEAR